MAVNRQRPLSIRRQLFLPRFEPALRGTLRIGETLFLSVRERIYESLDDPIGAHRGHRPPTMDTSLPSRKKNLYRRGRRGSLTTDRN